MKKGLIIAGVLLAGVTTFVLVNKHSKNKFNKNCRAKGGTVIEDGKLCRM